AHARSATVVWHRVAKHGDIERMKAKPLRRRLENLVLFSRRERRHRQRLRSRGLERIATVITGDADLPLCFFVIGFKILVADWPVLERASFHRAIRRSHAEVLLHEAPRHRAVTERATAYASGVVRVFPARGIDNAFAA